MLGNGGKKWLINYRCPSGKTEDVSACMWSLTAVYPSPPSSSPVRWTSTISCLPLGVRARGAAGAKAAAGVRAPSLAEKQVGVLQAWPAVRCSALILPIELSSVSFVSSPLGGTVVFLEPVAVLARLLLYALSGLAPLSPASVVLPAPESGRPATSTLNRFSALQQSAPSASAPSTADGDRRVPQRSVHQSVTPFP